MPRSDFATVSNGLVLAGRDPKVALFISLAAGSGLAVPFGGGLKSVGCTRPIFDWNE